MLERNSNTLLQNLRLFFEQPNGICASYFGSEREILIVGKTYRYYTLILRRCNYLYINNALKKEVTHATCNINKKKKKKKSWKDNNERDFEKRWAVETLDILKACVSKPNFHGWMTHKWNGLDVTSTTNITQLLVFLWPPLTNGLRRVTVI